MSGRFILFLLILFCSCGKAQKREDDILSIKTLIKNYNEAYTNKDWEYVAKVLHPQVFTFFERKEYIKSLQETFKREYYTLISNELIIDSISNILYNQSDKYAFLYLSTKSLLEISDKIDSTKRQKISLAICQSLKEEFSNDFVRCNGLDKSISYIIREKCYAIFLSEEKKWFILTKDQNTEKIIDKIIPKSVRENLEY